MLMKNWTNVKKSYDKKNINKRIIKITQEKNANENC